MPDTSVEFCDVDDSLHYFNLSSEPEPEPDSPEFQAWVPNLALTEADKQILCDGDWLNANLIAAGNMLLKAKFPYQNGLQDTCLLSKKRWNSSQKSLYRFCMLQGITGCALVINCQLITLSKFLTPCILK